MKKRWIAAWLCLMMISLCVCAAADRDNGVWQYKSAGSGKMQLTGYVGAERIKKLEFPEEIDGCPVTIIGNGSMFLWLNEVGQRTELIFPDTTEEIRGEFFTLGSFGKVVIPASVKTIGKNAFAIAAVTEFEFEGAPMTFGDRAFAENLHLKQMEIPEGVETIGGSCFEMCDRMTSVTLPASLKWLGAKCFSGNVKLSSVKFAPGCAIPEIPMGCFISCAIKSIDIPKSVTKIGTNAFYGCEKLTAVTIPAGVTSIASDAFSGCADNIVFTVTEGSYGHDWAAGKGYKVKTVPAPVTVTAPDGSTVAYYELKPGSKGPEVLEARTKLYELGYFSKVPTQTEYTENMKDYVKKFEKDYGLEQDGILSPEDQAILFAQ